MSILSSKYTVVVKSTRYTIGTEHLVITKQRGSSADFSLEPLLDLAPNIPSGSVNVYLTTTASETQLLTKTPSGPDAGIFTYSLSDVETATLSGVYMLYLKIGSIIYEPVKVNFQ